MRTVLAATAGALTALGFYMIVLGWRGTPIPRLPRPRRRPRGPRGSVARTGWARWRWPVAVGTGALVWAVSGWPVTGVIVTATVIGLPVLLTSGSLAAARIDRVEAIEEWTRRLADVLLTGVGLEQAIATSARTAPARIRGEVGALVARLTARWSTEDALRAFADDLDDAAGDLITASLLLASRRRGPGLARVLGSVADAIAEDVAARRRIEAERARPRATARAVTFITLAVVVAGALNGNYLAPYAEPLGQVVLAVVAAGFFGCLAWMKALTLARPDPRFLSPAVSR